MTRALRYVVRAALAFAILGFVPGALSAFSAPKAAGIRTLGLCLLVVVSVEALICRLRKPRPMPRSSPSQGRSIDFRMALAMDLAVVVWVSVAVLSVAASVSPRLSLTGEIQQREGLLTMLAIAGCYAATRRSHTSQAHVRHTLDLALVGAAVAAGYALVQFAGWDPVHWGQVPIYPAGAGSVPRPFGTLGNPIMLGAVLAPALGITLARMACGSGQFLGLAALAALLATALMSTLSRGSWLAAGAAVLATLAGSWLLGGARTARRAALAVAAAAIPTGLWCLAALRAPLLARIGEGGQTDATSGPARLEIARAAFSLWRVHPWLGGGPDTFGLLFPRVQTAAYWSHVWQGLPVHAHSAALQILATGGSLAVAAALFWMAAIVAAAVSAWTSASHPRSEVLEITVALAAVGVAGALNQVGIAGAVLVALLSALLVRGDAPRDLSCRAPAAARALAGLTGLALAVALTPSNLAEVRALGEAGQARAALDLSVSSGVTNRLSLTDWAARQAEEAVATAPGEDELWRLCCDAQLAHAREAIRSRDRATAVAAAMAAEGAAHRALGLEPQRAANLQRLGNVLALQAQLELEAHPDSGATASVHSKAAVIANRADSVFAAASRYAPYDALILVDWARAQLGMHRAEKALRTARRIASMYPGNATGYALEGAAYLTLGLRGAAHQALQEALGAKWEEGSDAARKAAQDYLRALEAEARANTK